MWAEWGIECFVENSEGTLKESKSYRKEIMGALSKKVVSTVFITQIES